MDSNLLVSNAIRFILLFLLQVLVLMQLNISNYIIFFIYPMYVILLPIRTPLWLILISGFVLGILIDWAYNSLGLHAASLVFIGFLRPLIMSLLEPRGGYSLDRTPNSRLMGSSWFLRYAGIMLFLHILFYSIVLSLGIGNWLETFLRIIFSFIFSYILIILPQYIYTMDR